MASHSNNLIQKIIQKSARDLVQVANIQEHENVLIFFDYYSMARSLATELAKLVTKKGARVWYRLRDLEIEKQIFTFSSRKNIERFYAFLNLEFMEADTIFMLRALEDPFIFKTVPEQNLKYAHQAQEPVYSKYRVNHTNWQLIYLPSEFEAKLEGLTFNEYLQLFYNAISPNWNQVAKAQQKVIEILDKAETLELIANPNDKDPKKRTHVFMSIKGMEFINSTINRNYPGSEIFSAPVKNSVNGQIFGKGTYMLGHSFKKVEDIYLKIENGKIIEAQAKKGEKDLIDFLNTDDGSRYFGEVALGTNYGLKRRVFNPLLNEKVGGSFHMAVGNSYEDMLDDFTHKIKHIDNGNRSVHHWDITIPMLPEYGGGKVIADGKVIQENGRFLVKGAEGLG